MFKYYVAVLINDIEGGHYGAGHSFIERETEISTQEDVEAIQALISEPDNLPTRSITIINWKRLD